MNQLVGLNLLNSVQIFSRMMHRYYACFVAERSRKTFSIGMNHHCKICFCHWYCGLIEFANRLYQILHECDQYLIYHSAHLAIQLCLLSYDCFRYLTCLLNIIVKSISKLESGHILFSFNNFLSPERSDVELWGRIDKQTSTNFRINTIFE